MRSGTLRLPALAALRGDVVPAFWPLVDQGVISGANFLIQVVIARRLGRYDFGLFTIAWSWLFVAATIQTALISAPMFSLGPRLPASDQPAYRTWLLLEQLALAAIVFIVCFALVRGAPLVAPGWVFAPFALALATAGACFLVHDFVRKALFAGGNRRAAALCDTLGYPGQLALLLLFAGPGCGLDRVLWIRAASLCAAAAIGVVLLRPLRLQARGFAASAAEQWRFGRWLLGAAVANAFSANVAIAVGGAVLGASAIAGLRAAELLVSAPAGLLFQSLDNFVPSLAVERLQREGPAPFWRFLRRWTWLGLAASLALAAVGVAAPDFWLGLLFGRQMAGAADLVYVVALRSPILLFALMASVALRSFGNTAVILRADALACIVAVASVFPVARVFGILGLTAAYTVWPAVAVAVMGLGLWKGLHRLPAGPQPAD